MGLVVLLHYEEFTGFPYTVLLTACDDLLISIRLEKIVKETANYANYAKVDVGYFEHAPENRMFCLVGVGQLGQLGQFKIPIA